LDVVEPTLDDVFLATTGHTLEGAGDDEDAGDGANASAAADAAPVADPR